MSNKEKHFKDLDKMMEYVGGLRTHELKSFIAELAKVDKELSNQIKKKINDHNGYICIPAYDETAEFCSRIKETLGINIITMSIHDGDRSTTFAYTDGIGRVNREYFLFCRSFKSVFCEET